MQIYCIALSLSMRFLSQHAPFNHILAVSSTSIHFFSGNIAKIRSWNVFAELD